MDSVSKWVRKMRKMREDTIMLVRYRNFSKFSVHFSFSQNFQGEN